MAATFHAVGNGEQTGGAASFSITTTISAGDFLVVVASWDSASTTTPTVATTGGTGSDAGTLILGPITAGSFSLKYAAWLISSAGAGRTGVTVSWASSSPSFADGYCWSASGLTTPTLDKSPNTSGNSTNPSSGTTGTLSTADQFCVSFAASASVTIGVPGGGFTDDGNTGSTGSRAGHQVVAATTALTGSFTAATSAWAALALTIKAGGAVAAPFYTTDWGVRGAVKDVAGGPPQRFVRNPNLFPNPIPFSDQQQRHTRNVPLVGPPQSLPRNLNLFTNPIPFGPFFYPPATTIQGRQAGSSGRVVQVASAAPFAQLDWKLVEQPPNSVPQSLPLNTNLFTNPIPFKQTDWSTTKDLLPSTVRDQPYNLSLYTVVVAAPFYQLNWPIPKATLPSVPLAQQNTLLLAQPPAGPDLSTSKFLNPRAPDATQQTNINLFTNPIPFSQTDWPQAKDLLQSKGLDQPYNQSLYTITVTAPFFQSDWSNSKFQAPRAPDASKSTSINLFPDFTLTMVVDWSGSGSSVRFRAPDLQPYNQSLYGVFVPPTPFVPVDFSRPFVLPPVKVDVQSVNTNLFTNPTPLNQIDWSKPYRIVPIASDQNNLPNLLLIQPSIPGSPLGVFQWVDLWKYTVPYPATPILLPNLTLVLPPGPVTPVTFFPWSGKPRGGGKYRGWRPLKKKKLTELEKLQEELEELEELLRAAEEAAPKPLAPYKPIVYHGPLSAIFAEPIEPRTAPQVRAVISRVKAQAQRLENDDEEALVMLLLG